MVQTLPPSPLGNDLVRDITIFYLFSALALSVSLVGLLPYRAFACGRRVQQGSSASGVRRRGELAAVVLLPCLSLALAYDSLALAVAVTAEQWPVAAASIPGSGAISTTPPSTVIAGVLKLRAAIQPFIIPLFLVTMFELNYEVHKRRNANFFFGCIRFDQGKRSASSLIGVLVRYSVWILALVLLVLFNLINALYMTDPTLMLETTRFGSKRLGIYSTADGSIGWTDAMDFFPYCVLLGFSFYTGASVWRYGSTISTDVRSTIINPWMSIFIASIGLTLAWVLTPTSWLLPYAVNGMEIILLIATAITLVLVDKNLRTLEEWDATLEAVNEAVLTAMAQNSKLRELQELRKVRARKHRQARSSASQLSAIAGGQMVRQHPRVGRPSVAESEQSLATESSVRIHMDEDADADQGPETTRRASSSSQASLPAATSMYISDKSLSGPIIASHRQTTTNSDALVSDEVARAVHAAALEEEGVDEAPAATLAVASTLHRVTGTTAPRSRASINALPEPKEPHAANYQSIGKRVNPFARAPTYTPEHWVHQERQWRAQIDKQRDQGLAVLRAEDAGGEAAVEQREHTAGKSSIPLWSRTFAEAELEQRIVEAARRTNQESDAGGNNTSSPTETRAATHTAATGQARDASSDKHKDGVDIAMSPPTSAHTAHINLLTAYKSPALRSAMSPSHTPK